MVSALGEVGFREGLIVCGYADSGRVGYGEIAPWPGLSSESLARATSAAEQLLSKLPGESLPQSLSETTELLDSASTRFELPSSTRFGFELMLADLASRAAALPLCDWLSTSVCKSLPINAFLTGETEEIVEQVDQKLGAGFQTFKLKLLGVDLQADLDRVRTVRTQLGSGPKLRLDANRGFTFDQALHLCDELTQFDIEYVEEPLCESDLEHLPELVAQTGIDIALDETVTNRQLWETLLQSGAVKIVVLKPMLVDGLAGALELAGLARSCGAKVVITTMVESGIGTAGCLHLAAALGEDEMAHGLDTLSLLQDDLLAQRLSSSDGRMNVPTESGLGVEFNDK